MGCTAEPRPFALGPESCYRADHLNGGGPLTGFALALARAVGEYGSVIFIAGNLPFQTEIAPLLIVIRLEEFDYNGAVAIAVAMLAISFVLLLLINLIQVWSRRHTAGA